MNKKLLSALGYLAAIVLIGLSVIYFTHPANQLPTFMPGYDATITKMHFKHGIGLVGLAFAALAFAWFAGGPSAQSEK